VGSVISILPRLPSPPVEVLTAAKPLLPTLAEGAVRSWALNSGDACYGYEAGGYSWIHLPEVATFRFSASGSSVETFFEHGLTFAKIRDTYERSVLPLIVQAMGVQVLHASGVLGDSGLMVLAGVSASGKSTISYALGQRGFPLWADDAVAFFVDGDTVRSSRLPFSPRLRPAAAESLGTAPPAMPVGATQAPPIEAVVLLRQDHEFVGVSLDRLRPTDAFPALLPQAYCFSVESTAGNRELVDEYLRLVELVPVWSIRFRPDLGNLPKILEKLEALIAE
jgi:hypothetical protein